MSVPEDIMNDFIENEDDLVLMCDMSIGRLKDVEETDFDYYWVIQKMHGKEEHYSCVMGFITLKDQLKEEDYNRINSVFKMNE